MSERQLIHKTKVPDFMSYLFHRYGAEITKPANGEVFRVKIGKDEIGFSRREGSDHLTTWGIGSRLAREYVNDKVNKH